MNSSFQSGSLHDVIYFTSVCGDVPGLHVLYNDSPKKFISALNSYKRNSAGEFVDNYKLISCILISLIIKQQKSVLEFYFQACADLIRSETEYIEYFLLKKDLPSIEFICNPDINFGTDAIESKFNKTIDIQLISVMYKLYLTDSKSESMIDLVNFILENYHIDMNGIAEYVQTNESVGNKLLVTQHSTKLKNFCGYLRVLGIIS
jgi:hypothetical protein